MKSLAHHARRRDLFINARLVFLPFSFSSLARNFHMTAASSVMSDVPTVDLSVRGSEPFVRPATTTNAIGILQHSILPSFGVQGGLGIIAYSVARASNRVDLKDWLWPTGVVLNAWWTAVGRHVTLSQPTSIITAFQDLSFSQKALLGAVTAWGARLAYQVISRCLRRGEDDPRYQVVKRQPGFWNKASLLFALEAAFQTVISIPFTMPFRTDSLAGFSSATAEWAPFVRWSAAGLFTAGLALESIADWQLASHKKREAVKKEQGESGELYRQGVFSIVRHPNYLGDALCHMAFPLWTYGCGLFHASQILGPAANYFFLRWIGGDRENEASQMERYKKQDKYKYSQLELYQLQKNAFWPGLFEIGNPWYWTISAIGAAGALAEWIFESRILDAGTAVNPVSPVVGETIAALN